jgi:DNA-binding protein HU-beta
MGKSELFSHFADRFEVKRTQAREFFDELNVLAEKELKRSGEFVLPGMVKLVVQKRKARMGRNPATGEQIKIPAKTVVKARIAKQLKDAVLPKKSSAGGPQRVGQNLTGRYAATDGALAARARL